MFVCMYTYVLFVLVFVCIIFVTLKCCFSWTDQDVIWGSDYSENLQVNVEYFPYNFLEELFLSTIIFREFSNDTPNYRVGGKKMSLFYVY